MPQPLTNCSDPLVRRIVLHVFNKYHADHVSELADGTKKVTPSKKKYVHTHHELLTRYGLDISPTVIKAANAGVGRKRCGLGGTSLEAADANTRLRLPSPPLLPPYQGALALTCLTEAWQETDDGYDSGDNIGEVVNAFPLAAPAGPRAGSSSLGTPSTHELRTYRALQSIQGHMANISQSLRVIAEAAAGGSRASARASLNALLNCDATPSEDGQHLHSQLAAGHVGSTQSEK